MDSGATAISERQSPAVAVRARSDLVELSLGYALILVVIWTPRPWQRLSYCFAAAFLLTVLFRSFAGWHAIGLQSANLARSSWLIGVSLLAATVAVIVAARLHTLHAPSSPILLLKRYAGYAIGACIQQILLQIFFLPRLLRLTRGTGSAVLLATAMFALAHLPNPILTVITFVWGLAACLFFLRYRSLYTLAIAHAVLGSTVAMVVPGPLIHNMRVGVGYLTYTSHPGHQPTPETISNRRMGS